MSYDDEHQKSRGRTPGSAQRTPTPEPPAPGKHTRTEALLRRARAAGGGKATPSVDDVATAAVEGKGTGQALDGGVKDRVEPHLGADLSGVRVHTDEDAGTAATAIGARAFAYQNDVFLGPGESSSDVKLMAHELTHVVQQGSAKAHPQRKVTVGSTDDPAEAEADRVADRVASGPPAANAQLLVEDGAPAAPHQMTRGDAIARLRQAAGGQGGQVVDQFLAQHEGKGVAALEAMARKAIGGGKPASAQELLAPLVAKLTGGAGGAAAAGGAGGNVAAELGGGTAALKPATTADLVQRLGNGSPLDSTMASAASEAYGANLSNVRVHTGPAAARLAAEHGARAFTVGNHVAFGAGEYAPGTPVGDAIMAHELAHVAQQDGADPTVRRKSLEVDGNQGAEGEADQAAQGVLARLYGGARGAASTVANRITANRDLSLQRCEDAPASMPKLEAGVDHKEWSVDQFVAVWEKKHGRKMNDVEKETLAAGCIGITALNLGMSSNPPLGLSFSTFDQAKKVQRALNEIVKAKPAADQIDDMIDANPALKNLKNVLASMPVDPDPKKWRAVIFSKRFFSRQTGTWEERKHGDPSKFQPDKNGQVDMSGDRYVGRADVDEGPGNYMINFDYGWWDEETDSWLHANHADPGMKVYQSTLDYYSRPLRNFDRQIFCVAFAKVGK